MKNLFPGNFLRHIPLYATILVCCTFCKKRTKSELVWDRNFPRIGSQSSPRVTDLNGDGTLDVVMGAGENEYRHSPQGVLAVDGATGDILWQTESEDQVYGCATLYDITGDGIDDVFIGGRSPQFRALDGRDGKVIWQFRNSYANHPVLRHARFNFNNSVLVPDQNSNGYPELLTVNGGNSKAAPYSTVERFPGVLILFDSKTGSIVAADTMPDGKESYMSPLCFRQKGATDYTVVFGTGGETLSGSLYQVSLKSFLNGGLSESTVIATEKGHGFIAPPVVADLTDDGYLDIVAISHGSTAFAVDGRTAAMLWKRNIPETECSNSFAVGYFTGDDIPDLFTFVSRGQWPNSAGSLQIMIDGRDGSIAYQDSIGCTGFSSPVVYDIDGDKRDEAIISINDFDCALGFTGETPRTIENRLIVIDFSKGSVRTIDQQKGFKNIFSTPWIGDLNGDGYLDIVHGQYYHHGDLLNFLGMRLKRIDTPIRMKSPPLWGAYMGSAGDGVFLGR